MECSNDEDKEDTGENRKNRTENIFVCKERASFRYLSHKASDPDRDDASQKKTKNIGKINSGPRLRRSLCSKTGFTIFLSDTVIRYYSPSEQ